MRSDASIYGQIQLPRPVNMLADVAQITALQGAQNQNALAQYTLKKAEREDADNSELRSALGSGTDPYNALLRIGRVKEAGEYQKGKNEARKVDSEIGKNDVDIELKAIGVYRDASQAITDPQSAAAFLTTMHSDPRLKNSAIARVPVDKLIAQVPQDPAGFDGWKKQFALGATKFIEQNAPKVGTRDLGGVSEIYSTPGLGGAPTVLSSTAKTATPGEVMTDTRTRSEGEKNRALQRERLDFDKNAPRGQFIETTNGFVLADPRNPNNVQPVTGPDGKPLKGKAADRSLNETQAKANLFGTRMKEAHRILGEVDGKYSPMAVNSKMAAGDAPVIGGMAGAVGNALLSTEGQQAEQAQRDFINAVLRRESGAAIASSEFDNARKQYFPQPNDDDKTRKQKKANRELAIRGLEAEVPGGFRATPTLTSTGNTGGAEGEWGNDPLGLRK